MNISHSDSLIVPVATISRCDRWQAYQRLQDLGIPCSCSASGGLDIEVNSVLAILQLRSVVQHLTASRSDLLDWLQRCWQAAGTDK